MQRLFNLEQWKCLSEGTQVDFRNPRPRTVRLELNSPGEAALYLIDGEGETFFLALVKGRDVVEFSAPGAFSLTVEGSDVYVLTVDGDDVSFIVVAPRIFTKIMERRRRNPELEYVTAMMQRNVERRLEQQSRELQQLFARRLEAAEQVSATRRLPSGSGGEPGPDNRSQPPPAVDAESDRGGSGNA